MPSIWMTSKSRPERSDAIQSLVRAADSATKRREAADFDRPAPAGAGTSPSGNRTDRANLRVATLINIWFMAHLPSQSSATATSQLGTGRVRLQWFICCRSSSQGPHATNLILDLQRFSLIQSYDPFGLLLKKLSLLFGFGKYALDLASGP